MKYSYFEVPYDPKKDMVYQLNEICEQNKNCRFQSMAQKISKTPDFKTGQPKVEFVLIMEQFETEA